HDTTGLFAIMSARKIVIPASVRRLPGEIPTDSRSLAVNDWISTSNSPPRYSLLLLLSDIRRCILWALIGGASVFGVLMLQAVLSGCGYTLSVGGMIGGKLEATEWRTYLIVAACTGCYFALVVALATIANRLFS